MNEQMHRQYKKHLAKVNRLYVTFGVVLSTLFFCLIFPPIIALFDRNDIWVGIMPLSQFFIVIFTSLSVVSMIVLYLLDKKYTGQGE